MPCWTHDTIMARYSAKCTPGDVHCLAGLTTQSWLAILPMTHLETCVALLDSRHNHGSLFCQWHTWRRALPCWTHDTIMARYSANGTPGDVHCLAGLMTQSWLAILPMAHLETCVALLDSRHNHGSLFCQWHTWRRALPCWTHDTIMARYSANGTPGDVHCLAGLMTQSWLAILPMAHLDTCIALLYS